jgi:hypothetical protein
MGRDFRLLGFGHDFSRAGGVFGAFKAGLLDQ